MPAKGFKSISVPTRIHEKFTDLQNVLHREGLSTVPEELFPTNYHREGPVTVGLLLEIAMNALQKARKERK